MAGIPTPIALVAAVAAIVAVAGCGGGSASPQAADGAAAPVAVAAATQAGTQAGTPPLPGDSRRGPSLLTTPIRLIDGSLLRPAALDGRVVLVVNTASRCGFTPQFEGLEALHEAKGEQGLTIVGFPSNDFRQELVSGDEIKDFCELNYGVSFPMAAKGRVTGPDAQPLFARIAARPGPVGEEPGWNFTKYLLDRDGRLVARYDSSVEPDDPALVEAVERLLGEGA
ncbi:MAG TPA: glutathione peroxidase [Miltoncostaeaceae bacterium]|nr:glutathione peroxidase [Miltoncostaeaceae bacterium]